MIKMGSFRSYVGLEEYEMKIPNPVTSTFLQPNFLPGELVVGEAHNVLKFTSLSKKKGLSGSLFVTNARLVFVSSTSSSELTSSYSPCSEDSIPLLSIHTLCYYESSSNHSGGKKSKKKVYLGPYNISALSSMNSSYTTNPSTTSLSSNSPVNSSSTHHQANNSHLFCSVSTRIHELYVICSNFRTIRVSFKFSRVDHGQKICNALIHWSFPQQIEKLFYLDYCRGLDKEELSNVNNKVSSFNDGFNSASTTFSSGIVSSWIPSFIVQGDWLRELKITRTSGFRLTEANINFELCQSLPEHFVVPAAITDVRLISLANKLRGNRPPFWVWGDGNGAAILRMAKLFNEADSSAENAFYETLRKSSIKRKPPRIYDLDNAVTIKEIRQSLTKLSELCCPESFSQYEETDTKFYSLLEQTKWMLWVSKVLSYGKDIADCLIAQGDIVILQENESRDVSCLFSSIVQIIVDARFRTMTGFCSLIQKEWVITGHQFHSVYMHTSPVFLLFLDSVHQLLVQNPFEFEFNEEFLSDLWDSCFDSTTGTFMFDSPFQRSSMELRKDLTAWYRVLTKHESLPNNLDEKSQNAIPTITKSLYNPMHKLKPLLYPPSMDKFIESQTTGLSPLLECLSPMCNLEFWTSLFLDRTVENLSSLPSSSIINSPLILPFSKNSGSATPVSTTPSPIANSFGSNSAPVPRSPGQASMFLFSSASNNNNEIINGESSTPIRGRDFMQELKLVDILLKNLSASTRLHKHTSNFRGQAPSAHSVPLSSYSKQEELSSGKSSKKAFRQPKELSSQVSATALNSYSRPGIDRPLPRVNISKQLSLQYNQSGSLGRRKNPFFTSVQES